MDKFVYLVEYWCYDLEGDETISVHESIFGAEETAKKLAEEQFHDEDAARDTNQRLTWHRNEEGQGIAEIEIKDGEVLESWTVVRAKLEE